MEDKHIIIRRFENDDLENLYNMIDASFDTYELDVVYEKKVKAFWQSLYTKEKIIECAKTNHLYVATINDKIVGSGAIGKEKDGAYISAVFVDPNTQGKGIGKLIMTTLENDELALNSDKLCLTAALSAGKFYQKLGFTYKYKVPEIVLDGCLDVVYMEKQLNHK